MFIDKKNQLIEKIKLLKELGTDLKDKNILLKIDGFEKEIKDDLTFNVLCLGDFSSGKSTFINQFFIGKNPLPTNVTTTTAKLTVIKYGEEEKINIKYKDGSNKEYSDDFENILKDSVAKNGKDIEEIDFVEVYIDSTILKEGVIIIDSPGLNDPETERMQVTYDYIEKADSVLYLLTAIQAWKKSEKEFLEEKIFRKEDLDKLFFLLNYWDMIDKNQQTELLKYITMEIKKSLKIASAEIGKELSVPPLIPISAKTKENFDILKEQLWTYLGTKKGKDILEAKYTKFSTLKNNIIILLEERILLQKQEKNQLDSNIEELENDINKYKEEVKTFKKALEKEVAIIVSEWMDEISEFQELLGNKINMKISHKINTVNSTIELEKMIRESIQKTILIEKNELDYKNKKFIKNIHTLVEEKKAKLKLEKYFIKNNIIDLGKLNDEMKEISPDIKYDYQTDVLITGGSATVAGILAIAIAPPLALVGLFSLGYGEFIAKPKKFQEDILKLLPEIEDQISSIVNDNINKLRNKDEYIIDSILNQISNDIIEAYKEKERIYNSVLEDKNNDQDSEIISSLEDKISKLVSL